MHTDMPPKPSLAPHSVDIGISPPTVHLGQPFSLNVALGHPEHFRLELLPPPHHPSLDILSNARSRKEGPQGATTTFSIQMAAFELGSLELPSFQVEIAAAGETDIFVLPSQHISVVTSLAQAPSQLEDVRPPAPLFVSDYAVLYGGAAVVAMVLAFLLTWKWLRQRKKEAPSTVPARPLAQRTREALQALWAQALPAQGKTREYYFMLSEILRGYIGELHQLDAMECTTTELVASLQRLPSTQIPLEAFAQFSYEADFIKYAKGSADMAKCEADLAFAFQLIDKTTPPDELSSARACHVQPSLP